MADFPQPIKPMRMTLRAVVRISGMMKTQCREGLLGLQAVRYRRGKTGVKK